MLHLVVVNKKRKEKKRNINNDLANLPSHDRSAIACVVAYFRRIELLPGDQKKSDI